jgi:plastocyanin
MTTGRLTLLIAFVAAALSVVANVAAATPKLTGEVGPGFTIELKQGSKDVKTLKAGTYTIKVEDKASIHNFHLFGPGLNKSTSIGGTAEQTWTVKLKKGTYTYQCDPHAASGMQGTFRVTG